MEHDKITEGQIKQIKEEIINSLMNTFKGEFTSGNEYLICSSSLTSISVQTFLRKIEVTLNNEILPKLKYKIGNNDLMITGLFSEENSAFSINISETGIHTNTGIFFIYLITRFSFLKFISDDSSIKFKLL